MRLGPFDITRRKNQAPQNLITQWPDSRGGGWWPILREGFSGAWQRGIVAPIEDALTHPTFFGCVTLIAGDIAKMRLKLVTEDEQTGICTETTNSAYSPVLRKPNHYQNRIQFVQYWLLSKLTRGNAYALKERDNRGVVTALYLLDPMRVRPMVTPSGAVYYSIGQDVLSGVTEANTLVPASEIIHDPMYALYHPLVGLSPVYACGHAAMQGLEIIGNTTRLVKNGTVIGGVITVPGALSDTAAMTLRKNWDDNYTGSANVGKVAVLSDGMKFDQSKIVTAVDAQIIDQLKWGDEKICSVFHVPPYMVGVGPEPSNANVEARTQNFYSQCLQILIESLELCLDEGLELKSPYDIECDLDGLMRMDSVAQMEYATKGVTGGIFSPDEARQKFNKAPTPGGDRVFLQKQNWPLEILGHDDPLVQPAPAPVAMPTTPAPTKAADDWDEAASIFEFKSKAMLLGLPEAA